MTRPIRSVAVLALATAPLLALGGAAAHPIAAHVGASLSRGATAVAQPPVLLFVLHEDSSYVYGCFPAPPFPCAGPLVFTPDFSGILGATLAGVDDDGFTLYELSGIDLVAGFGESAVHVEGSGLYRRTFGEGSQQEMILDVMLDGAPAAFASGVVPVPAGSIHFMDVSVNMNDLQNYDVVLNIVAGPGKGAPAAPSLLALQP